MGHTENDLAARRVQVLPLSSATITPAGTSEHVLPREQTSCSADLYHALYCLFISMFSNSLEDARAFWKAGETGCKQVKLRTRIFPC